MTVYTCCLSWQLGISATLNSAVTTIRNSANHNLSLKPAHLNYKATFTSSRYPRTRCGGINDFFKSGGLILTNFGPNMASNRPGRLLKRFLEAVAPFWLNISPWRATKVPFRSIFIIFFKFMFNWKLQISFNSILGGSRGSRNLKFPINVVGKVSNFDIHLPQWSIFEIQKVR